MFALSVRHCPIPFERNSNQPVPNQLLVWIRASPTRFNNATQTRIQMCIANIIKSSANGAQKVVCSIGLHWNIKTLKSLTLQCLSHRFQGTAASDKWTTWARSRSQLSASEKQSHDKDEAVHTTTILVHWLFLFFLGPVSERKDCVRTTISRHNSGRPLSDVKLHGCLTF